MAEAPAPSAFERGSGSVGGVSMVLNGQPQDACHEATAAHESAVLRATRQWPSLTVPQGFCLGHRCAFEGSSADSVPARRSP
jgi:hypothetical protein